MFGGFYEYFYKYNKIIFKSEIDKKKENDCNNLQIKIKKCFENEGKLNNTKYTNEGSCTPLIKIFAEMKCFSK